MYLIDIGMYLIDIARWITRRGIRRLFDIPNRYDEYCYHSSSYTHPYANDTHPYSNYAPTYATYAHPNICYTPFFANITHPFASYIWFPYIPIRHIPLLVIQIDREIGRIYLRSMAEMSEDGSYSRMFYWIQKCNSYTILTGRFFINLLQNEVLSFSNIADFLCT